MAFVGLPRSTPRFPILPKVCCNGGTSVVHVFSKCQKGSIHIGSKYQIWASDQYLAVNDWMFAERCGCFGPEMQNCCRYQICFATQQKRCTGITLLCFTSIGYPIKLNGHTVARWAAPVVVVRSTGVRLAPSPV